MKMHAEHAFFVLLHKKTKDCPPEQEELMFL